MNDNAAIPNNNTDKLYKLRLMINQLNSSFRMRLIMLALMKAIQFNETNKKSFQTRALADMDGYLYHCKVYQGKNQVFVDDSMPK